MLAHFREQVFYCDTFGSPFTARLIECFAADFQAGGPIAELVGAWPTSPRADAVALRLAGALHAAVLVHKDPALAAAYPSARDDWRIEEVWPLARDFLAREPAWAAEFIRSPPQTNETRRSIALLAGFFAFSERYPGAVDVLEIGASAGLNVNWDRFRYETQSWSWGPSGPVTISTDWQGPAPNVSADLRVRHRAACDLNPLDLNDPAQVLHLRAYIWADQPDRLARFDGAVALARVSNVQVERADAALWLAEKLAQRATDAPTIVYHSVFLQYPPRESRAAIIAAVEAAGVSATEQAPLAWVRFEPEALLGGPRDSARMVADLTIWPGGERRILGYTDGHVRAFEAVS